MNMKDMEIIEVTDIQNNNKYSYISKFDILEDGEIFPYVEVYKNNIKIGLLDTEENEESILLFKILASMMQTQKN